MKNVKKYISFLLFLLFATSQVKAECTPKAQDIPMYQKRAHLGARTTEPGVTASLEENQLAVNVSRYMGIVKVYVYDANGKLMVSSSVLIEGDGWCSLDLPALENGLYTVIVELGGVYYWGMLDI